MKDLNKEKIKDWFKKNKRTIAIGSLSAAAVVVSAVAVKSVNSISGFEKTSKFVDAYNLGRDLVMRFVDPANGDVLGEVACTESFMNDILSCM